MNSLGVRKLSFGLVWSGPGLSVSDVRQINSCYLKRQTDLYSIDTDT